MKQLSSCLCFLHCFAMAESVGPTEKIVPIDQEPSHKFVLNSESIRVFDAFFPAGEVSLYHRHEADSVLVCLEGADVASEEPGKPVVPRPPIPTGDIYYRPYSKTPLVHRVRNLSSTSFRILDIEVMKKLGHPIVLPKLPEQFSIAIDNDRVRVARLHLSPGESTEKIDFQGPRLLATLEAGKFTISFDLQSQRKTIDASPGTLDINEQKDKEAIANIGETPLDVVSIEIK